MGLKVGVMGRSGAIFGGIVMRAILGVYMECNAAQGRGSGRRLFVHWLQACTLLAGP
jgi:hypothetical protein